MLNPSEIAGKKFDRVMGRGYRAEDVDRFLQQVADETNELLGEKRELERKLMVLADKLEEYKNDEESLRSALIGAQKLGDSVVRDAKAKAEMILDDANAEANALIEKAKRAIEREQTGFVRMQREVATFRSKLQLIYKQHLELISCIPVDENIAQSEYKPSYASAPAPVEQPPKPVEPEYSSQEMELPEEFLPPEPERQEPLSYAEQGLSYTVEEDDNLEQEQNMRRESRFGPLKFGKEFDIKRDDDKRKK